MWARERTCGFAKYRVVPCKKVYPKFCESSYHIGCPRIGGSRKEGNSNVQALFWIVQYRGSLKGSSQVV